MTDCPHLQMRANNVVQRLTDSDGAVVGFTVGTSVMCNDCGCIFEFIVRPGSSLPERPTATVSENRRELRAAIKPSPVEQ